jgi:hypothetical protein
MRVVCLKWGQKYGPEYVRALADGLRRHGYSGAIECFTERARGVPSDVDVRPLPAPELPGWWGKLALFKPGLWPDGERILFLDLDTVPLGALGDIAAYAGPFAILRDFYFPTRLQSSVMAWPAGWGAHIWQSFEDAGRPMDERATDQGWIMRTERASAVRLQDVFPGRFVSYKVDCGNGLPPGASVLCFHGEPRPHQVTDPWLAHEWRTQSLPPQELTHG